MSAIIPYKICHLKYSCQNNILKWNIKDVTLHHFNILLLPEIYTFILKKKYIIKIIRIQETLIVSPAWAIPVKIYYSSTQRV